MKRHTDRKQTQWQGQMHYVLFHSWLNPPFIFSRLSHLAPHQFYDLFYVLCPQTPISLLKHPPLILIPLAASTLSLRLSLPLFLPFLFPSSLPSLSPPPRCAPDSLSFPSLTHSGSILPSPLLPSHSPLHASLSAPLATFLFPSPTNTYHPSHLPRLLPISLSSISSHSSLLLTHSLNLAVLPNAHVHTPMLIGTQGQSTLSPKPASRRFDLVASTLLDTELSWGRGPGRGHGAQPLPCFSPKREHLEHRAESLWSCPGMPSRTTTRHLL